MDGGGTRGKGEQMRMGAEALKINDTSNKSGHKFCVGLCDRKN